VGSRRENARATATNVKFQMNIETLHKLSEEYAKEGLYRGSFKNLSVTIYRQIDYANNVLLVESDENVGDEILTIYSIHEEATHCLYWSKESVGEFIKSIEPSAFPVQDFMALYKSHFRGGKIFEQIDSTKIESVYSLSSPAYDDWCGEFFIKSSGKKYVLLWDYSD